MEIVNYSEKLKQNVFSFTDACFSELGKKFEPEIPAIKLSYLIQ